MLRNHAFNPSLAEGDSTCAAGRAMVSISRISKSIPLGKFPWSVRHLLHRTAVFFPTETDLVSKERKLGKAAATLTSIAVVAMARARSAAICFQTCGISRVIDDRDAFHSIVGDGALKRAGYGFFQKSVKRGSNGSDPSLRC